MRRPDEIRLLYGLVTAPTRKLLLSELDVFARSPDADEVHDLLLAQMGHADATVRSQALATATRFLPGHARRRHGGELEMGAWSEFLAAGRASRAPEPDGDLARTAALRAAALERLSPLFDAVARAAPSLQAGPGDLAYAALALLPDAHARVPLEPETGPLWAWAHGGGGALGPDRLVAFLERHAADRPHLLVAAQALPPDAAHALAGTLARRVGWEGAANLALALAFTGARGAVELLRTVSHGGSGWTHVFVLRALEALPEPDALDLVSEIHDRATHEFVRAQAVRAAGAQRSERAFAFCRARLASHEAIVVAQALESLVRMRCPRDELAEAARPLTRSEDLRVRANAWLATVDPSDPVLPDGLVDLLRSADFLPRAEAAFCLGYWPSRRSLELLSTQVVSDPSVHVRAQAVKSFSKYPVATALSLLTLVVEKHGPAEALTAARMLSRLAVPDPRAVVRVFLAELARNPDPERRALLLTGLGGLMSRSPDATAHRVFTAALDVDDPRVQRAALQGLCVLGGASGSRVERLGAGTDPAVACAAAVARFLGGDVAVADELAAAVGGAGAPRDAAVRAALELALLATHVIGMRHEALGTALAAHTRAAPPSAPPAATGCASLPVPEEADFEVALTASAIAAGRRAAAPHAHQLSDIREISKNLEGLGQPRSTKVVPRTDLGGLRQGTYLVASAGRAAALEVEPPGRRLRLAAHRALALVRENPILLGPPLALLVVAAVVVRSLAGGGHARRAAKPALTLAAQTGPVTVGGDARPLATGDRVRTGDRVTLRSGDATLTGETGGEIRLRGRCDIGVVAWDPRYGLELDVRSGEIELASAAGDILVIGAGKRRINALGAALRCVVDKDECRVTARAGVVETVSSTGGRRVLSLDAEEVLR